MATKAQIVEVNKTLSTENIKLSKIIKKVYPIVLQILDITDKGVFNIFFNLGTLKRLLKSIVLEFKKSNVVNEG